MDNTAPPDLRPEAQALVDRESDKIIKAYRKKQKRFFHGPKNRASWKRMQRHSGASDRGMQKILNLVNSGIPALDLELKFLKEEKEHRLNEHSTIYSNEWS